MSKWPVNKWIVLLLVGGYAVLALDIRSEHQAVLGEETIAWAPIVYSIAMVILGLVSLGFWKSWGRSVMFWLFALGLAVGVVGFWQHNEEHFGQRIAYVFSVWGTAPAERQHSVKPAASDANTSEQRSEAGVAKDEKERGEEFGELKSPILPPVFAPLAFFGLGAIGMFVTLDRFQNRSSSGEQM